MNSSKTECLHHQLYICAIVAITTTNVDSSQKHDHDYENQHTILEKEYPGQHLKLETQQEREHAEKEILKRRSKKTETRCSR